MWGEPKDGLRLGVSPAKGVVGVKFSFFHDDLTCTVQAWFENVGDQPVRVPTGTFGKMARLQYGDKTVCLFDRLGLLMKRSPEWRHLAPGERFAEEFTPTHRSVGPSG